MRLLWRHYNDTQRGKQHTVHTYNHDRFCIRDDVIKWKPFPRCWPFVRGIHRSPVNSPHEGQWRGALMFSFIYAWINGWVNNREACYLRRHCAHYDTTVMLPEVEKAKIEKTMSIWWHEWSIIWKKKHLSILSRFPFAPWTLGIISSISDINRYWNFRKIAFTKITGMSAVEIWCKLLSMLIYMCRGVPPAN